jgi:hypothetical protein
MERQSVSSSNVLSVGYDSASETLEVEFNNGSLYQYYNVPQFHFERMLQGSVGSYLAREIKPNFACSPV